MSHDRPLEPGQHAVAGTLWLVSCDLHAVGSTPGMHAVVRPVVRTL